MLQSSKARATRWAKEAILATWPPSNKWQLAI